MLPTALTLRNYRSFVGPQRLELRPITLVYGRNSAGKSALLRSLPLLADSAAAEGLDALDFAGRVSDLELDFESLRWKGPTETNEYTVGIDLHWLGDPLLSKAELAFWEFPDWNRIVVAEMALYTGSDESCIDLRWREGHGDRLSHTLNYHRIARESSPDSVDLTFRGLRPSLDQGAEDPLFSGLSTLENRLKALSSGVTWLRSLRPAPPRALVWRTSPKDNLDPLGNYAPLVLGNNATVLEEVSSWYEEHLGHELRIESVGRRELRTVLRNKTKAAFDLDIIDTGEGLSQVLSVLTALALSNANSDRGPSILAVEEPEAHLHADLQRALAIQICRSVVNSKSRVILETHSKFFLLAMQYAILRGDLDEENVVVYWVHQFEDGRSVAEKVSLNDLARLRGEWPSHAFEDDLDLEAEIQDLRDLRERS